MTSESSDDKIMYTTCCSMSKSTIIGPTNEPCTYDNHMNNPQTDAQPKAINFRFKQSHNQSSIMSNSPILQTLVVDKPTKEKK